MPTRLIREGIISSERVDLLDAAAEVFYRRLLNKVDDHGLYDGRPSILRANLYPLRIDRVREADISRSLAACQGAGLIVLYENGGKPYLMALDTGWDKRSKPKYPLPDESIPTQPLTDPNTSTVVRSRSSLSVVVDDKGAGKPAVSSKSRKTSLPNGFGDGWSEAMRAWLLANCKNAADVRKHMDYFVGYVKANGKQYVDWEQAFQNAIKGDWAKVGSANTQAAIPAQACGKCGGTLSAGHVYTQEHGNTCNSCYHGRVA